MRKIVLLIAITFLLNGCAPWVRTGGPYNATGENVSLDLPDGWMRLNTDDYFLITRDGVPLQSILVQCINVNDSLKHTKKKFRKGMLPLEASEVIMDNIASNDKVHDCQVKESKSAKVAGNPGFRIVFAYKTDDGLKMKGVVYGLMQGEWFYVLKFAAPQRHYFDRDLKTFEQVVASARLIKS
ncbi:hypothetical protein [Geobacter sp. AOG1]|uniref:hypothetical protein n=1 Tax=Geobacter sp. AOG1 TaxID=1566346 RepID=UPI001CC4D9A3|nr:hypothetical protein [Geobacter sp. AOG1]GFE57423.1 hypothetical protein AOG1_13030 [Geobacter sp. AOG1]